MKPWNELPDWIRQPEVKEYYDILKKKPASLFIKRVFDFSMASVLVVVLSPVMAVIAVKIKSDSEGPVFFRQVRITRYGKEFRIHKFRTMVTNAESLGTQVTSENDSRITKIGEFLRKTRLDELPQLFDVLAGDMSFVGTRPEVKKYVDQYTPEMRATLLMPAGITSKASIQYKDEAQLLQDAENADETYINKVLPEKMKYNLQSIKNFSLLDDLKTMINTILAVME
jgi:lipopolysaccharide/colanic/teichoic acid biosynthesis glycosyltransferase